MCICMYTYTFFLYLLVSKLLKFLLIMIIDGYVYFLITRIHYFYTGSLKGWETELRNLSAF